MASQKSIEPVVLHLSERLDSQTGNQLHQQVLQNCPERVRLFAIDMHDVSFADSSGLFALVGTLRTARDRGSRLVLFNLKASVRVIFEISQLDLVFEIFDSYEAMVDFLHSEGILLKAKRDLIAA